MAEDETNVRSLPAQRESEDEAAKLNGGGKSIEDLTKDEGEDEEGQVYLDFGDAVNLTLRGKRPTESKLKFRPIQRDIKGQIGDKGDDEVYTFIVVGRLQDVQTPLRRDDAGRVISRKRVHILDPVDVQRVPDDLADEWLVQLDGKKD